MFASPVDESRDTTREMLAYRPQTAAEMLGISGVGQKKLDRYGDRFLSVLRGGPAVQAYWYLICELRTENPRVGSSILPLATILFERSQILSD